MGTTTEAPGRRCGSGPGSSARTGPRPRPRRTLLPPSPGRRWRAALGIRARLLRPGQRVRADAHDQGHHDAHRDPAVPAGLGHLALELDALTPGLLLAFGLGQTLLRCWVGHVGIRAWAVPKDSEEAGFRPVSFRSGSREPCVPHRLPMLRPTSPRRGRRPAGRKGRHGGHGHRQRGSRRRFAPVGGLDRFFKISSAVHRADRDHRGHHTWLTMAYILFVNPAILVRWVPTCRRWGCRSHRSTVTRSSPG